MLSLHIAQISVTSSLPYIFLASLGTIGLLTWRSWAKKKRYQSLQSLPSPPGHWLLGHIPQILAAVKQKQFFQLLFDWSQQYGPIYLYWAGPPVIILSKPSMIENVITNGMRDGSLIRSKAASRAWDDISGPILLGQSGAEWQWRRKAWNPEFSSSGLSEYMAVIDQACAQVIRQISAAPASEPVCVDALFVELTMRVIACLLLGIPIDRNSSSPEGPPLDVQKIYQAMAVIGYRFLRVATGEKRWKKYLPTQSARDYWAARRDLEEFLSPRIDLALQLRDQLPIDPAAISPLFQQSMLVKIAAKEPRYTRASLFAESVELLIAGTDTTAHTLSFTLGELALHPEICQKARSIVDQVWPSQGSLSLESLKDLNYLRAIVKETLRLYSIASGSTSLEAIKPIEIEGTTIPAGTRVFWSMLGAGRDTETYPEPEKFQPERWLTEGKPNLALPMIDFGSGPHRCLGEHLAMLEATLMLAALLHHFEWELVNNRSSLENLQQNLLIYPPDGMPLRFKQRQFQLLEQ